MILFYYRQLFLVLFKTNLYILLIVIPKGHVYKIVQSSFVVAGPTYADFRNIENGSSVSQIYVFSKQLSIIILKSTEICTKTTKTFL